MGCIKSSSNKWTWFYQYYFSIFIQFLSNYLKIDLKYDIGYNLIKWVYTDVFDNQKWDENFYLEMMKEASHYDLKDLKEK